MSNPTLSAKGFAAIIRTDPLQMNGIIKNYLYRCYAATFSGVVAGAVATLAQVLLWLVFTGDLPAILYRDARLTAAIVLGVSVLPPPATFDAVIMMMAALIHFALSVIYAAVLIPFVTHRKAAPALLVGAAFGLVLYIVNLYGFIAVFPWFAQARGWITLIAHAVFGVTVVMVFRWLEVSIARSRPGGH